MLLLCLLLMFLLLVLVGCVIDVVCYWVELDGVCYQVELVINDEICVCGLMFCDQMVIDYGMLFIYDCEEMQVYWMKNIRIVLDIFYFDSQCRLVSQQCDVLLCLVGDMCLFYFSGGLVCYVLEFNVGQVEKLQFKDGMELKFGLGIE